MPRQPSIVHIFPHSGCHVHVVIVEEHKEGTYIGGRDQLSIKGMEPYGVHIYYFLECRPGKGFELSQKRSVRKALLMHRKAYPLSHPLMWFSMLFFCFVLFEPQSPLLAVSFLSQENAEKSGPLFFVC